MVYVEQCKLYEELRKRKNECGYGLRPEIIQGAMNFLNFLNYAFENVIHRNEQQQWSVSMCETEEFVLWRYIYMDVYNVIASLQGRNLEQEYSGFAFEKRALRHTMEAYIDFVNLTADFAYIEVLKACANKSNQLSESEKYKKHLNQKGNFVAGKKREIAKEYLPEKEINEINDAFKKCNHVVHPDVFLKVPFDKEAKEADLRELLQLLFRILERASEILMCRYSGVHVYVGCIMPDGMRCECNVGTCAKCHRQYVENVELLLQQPLFQD